MKPPTLGHSSRGGQFEFVEYESMIDGKKRSDNYAAANQQQPQLNAKPIPQVHLSAIRFIISVLAPLGLLVAILVVVLQGIVIDKNVQDELGSTKNVEELIELYQTINGYITAFIGELTNIGAATFLAVAMTYFGNVKLYPGDNPRNGPGKFKWLLLWAFVPVVTFLLNVAISATFVSHKTTGILRVFKSEDLVATNTLSIKENQGTAAVSTLDTVLRSAVLRKAEPFEILPDSPCVLGNSTEDKDAVNEANSLPSVKEVRSTAVVYGFQPQAWNLDAMPFGLKPKHSIKFQFSDVNTSYEELATKFADFQTKTNVSWLTTYELLLQGKLLFERSISDANVSAEYPCVIVDGRYDLEPASVDDGSGSAADETIAPELTEKPATTKPPSRARLHANRIAHRLHRRSLQEGTDPAEGPEAGSLEDEWIDEGSLDFDDSEPDFDRYEEGDYKGYRRCYGAVSSLRDLANYTQPSMHKMDVFVDTMVDGFIATVPGIAPEEMDLTFETFEINPLMKLTVMTLDIPYLFNISYRDVSDYCASGDLLPHLVDPTWDPKVREAVRAIFCEQDNYPYVKPREACGHSNCIFLDKSNSVPFKKQLQLIPYLTNCSTADLKYSADLLSFLPQYCTPREDSVFLYGLGAYMGGELFDNGEALGFPYIYNPRRHVVLSFAKLEWELIDLSKKFDADCGVNSSVSSSGCMGLLHDLENVTVPAVDGKAAEKFKRLLLLGKDSIPEERMKKDYRNPVQLVNLNTRPFYYAKEYRYFEWEYLQKKRFNESNWPTNTSDSEGNLKGAQCSPLVDAYIAQVEANHYYIDDPTQPLYTAALYYLFQDAGLKTVKLTKNETTGLDVLELQVVGTTSLNGDLERHEIKFSLPLLSLISTFIGLGVLVLLALLALVCPTERLEKSDAANVLEQYAELLKDDRYPEEVFDRGLVLPSGERVQMDDYIADSITFHHVRDEDKKIYL